MNQPSPSPLRQVYTFWERTTAAYLEPLTRSPLFLTANANWLNGFLTLKKAADSGLRSLFSGLGLPTRRDQERTLHILHQITARLDDLEFSMAQQAHQRATAAEQPSNDGTTQPQPRA
ncbi:MAG: hypothetical protein CSA65_08210 [Proteobacteria bacterium]|nr:MAG: hypothetical protein CSA65_08210 [Pseudomonadota bacterium]